MTCGNCQHENAGGYTFCGHCGAALTDISVPSYPDRSRAVRREIGIVLAGIALVLAAAVGSFVLFYQIGSPDVVVRKFIEADLRADYAAESLYVSSGLDSRVILS